MDNEFSDDVNEWCKENFEQAARLFEKTVERKNIETFGKQFNPVEKSFINRDTAISKDDLTNLQILLGQSKTVDDFIKNI